MFVELLFLLLYLSIINGTLPIISKGMPNSISPWQFMDKSLLIYNPVQHKA